MERNHQPPTVPALSTPARSLLPPDAGHRCLPGVTGRIAVPCAPSLCPAQSVGNKFPPVTSFSAAQRYPVYYRNKNALCWLFSALCPGGFSLAHLSLSTAGAGLGWARGVLWVMCRVLWVLLWACRVLCQACGVLWVPCRLMGCCARVVLYCCALA